MFEAHCVPFLLQLWGQSVLPGPYSWIQKRVYKKAMVNHSSSWASHLGNVANSGLLRAGVKDCIRQGSQLRITEDDPLTVGRKEF